MNLLKSLTTISFITLFSRILGFVRDVIVAKTFGASIESDAFFIAFKIPNQLRRIFAEGIFSQTFIPILTEYKNKQGKKKARLFVAYITGLLTLVLVLVTLIGILVAPWIIILTAPGFIDIPEKFSLTIILLRIIFPYILLISLTSLVSAILNTWNYFSVPAFSSVFLNITMIVFALLATPLFHPPITALAWAIVIGGIIQLIYQLPYLKKIDMLVLPRIQLCDIGVWRVLQQMGNAIIGVSVNQISLIINTIFASFMVSGSISWIYYADRLIEFPSGIFGVALGTILLPLLSHNLIQGNYEEYSRLLDLGLRLCFILALPSSVGIGILAYPLTISLFQYGKFSAFDVLMTQHVLIAYTVGLVGFFLVKILASSFYSHQNVRVPTRIALLTLIVTQIMNIIFTGPLKHVGLSLSISLAAYFNAILLYWQLRRRNMFQPQAGWSIFFIRLSLAVIIMAAVLSGLLLIIPNWVHGNMLWRLIYLTITVAISAIVYFATLWIVGFRLHHFT